MTTFDVHMDKANKELRGKLDQAERERDEARADAAAFRRDFEAELSGARDIREEHGARADETFRQFIGRIVRERDEARGHARAAERDAVKAEARCAALTAERDEARAEQRDAEASRDLLVAGYTRAIREWLATHPGDSVPDVVDLFGAVMAERDEAGRAFRNLVAVLDRDGGQRQAGETIAGTLERATRIAADAVVGVDALRAERDAAVAERDSANAWRIDARNASDQHFAAERAAREKAEAGAAKLREAAQAVLDNELADGDGYPIGDCLRRLQEALASAPGVALLAEVEALRAVASAAKAYEEASLDRVTPTYAALCAALRSLAEATP